MNIIKTVIAFPIVYFMYALSATLGAIGAGFNRVGQVFTNASSKTDLLKFF